MANIPHDLGPADLGRSDHANHRGEVVFAGPGLNQVPAQAIADGSYIQPLQRLIILPREHVMLGCGDQIEPYAIAAAVT